MSVEGDVSAILSRVHVRSVCVWDDQIVLAVDEIRSLVKVIGRTIPVTNVVRFVHVQPEAV